MIKSDLSVVAEQLQRVEHKLDLVLEGLATLNPVAALRKVGDPEHTCPLCLQPVSYQLDIFKGHVTRQCVCRTGVLPGLNLIVPQTNQEPNDETPDD